jgi:subtilisin-like proprotein convertase family protein
MNHLFLLATYGWCAALLCCSTVQAQSSPEVISGLPIGAYVNEYLLGQGVEAFNITYSGGESQLAALTGAASSFPIGEGLVMSSGSATTLACSNEFCLDCEGDGYDADLNSIANEVAGLLGQSFTVYGVNDVASLEFDFVAEGDTVSFNYAFASDEYPSFVNSDFNDVFAFFISGPGIEGEYAAPSCNPNGSVNIAVVPGSEPPLPITVSSINETTNSEWYAGPTSGLPGLCVDGVTTSLTATFPVICGLTYHIRLAIGDGTDTAVDSYVVLEQGSFSSPAIAEVETLSEVGADDVLYEGCGLASVTLTRPEASPMDEGYAFVLDWSNGAAVNGEDFGLVGADGAVEALPTMLVLEPGDTELVLSIAAVDDGLDEDGESIAFAVVHPLACGGDGTITHHEIDLFDAPEPLAAVGLNSTVCEGTPVELVASVAGGTGDYTYEWSVDGSDEEALYFVPDSTITVELTVSDTCGVDDAVVFYTVSVPDYSDDVVVNVSVDEVVLGCGESVQIQASAEGGYGNLEGGSYSYQWYNDLWGWSYPSANFFDLNASSGYDSIAVRVIDFCGASDTVGVTISYDFSDYTIELVDSIEVSCGESFLVTPDFGPNFSSALWFVDNEIVGEGMEFEGTVTESGYVVVQATDACGGVAIDSVFVSGQGTLCNDLVCQEPVALINGVSPETVYACPGEEVLLSGEESYTGAALGITAWEWFGASGNAASDGTTLAFSADEPGAFELGLVVFATDLDDQGIECIASDTAYVTVAVSTAPEWNIGVDGGACEGDEVYLSGNATWPAVFDGPDSQQFAGITPEILPDDQTQCYTSSMEVQGFATGLTFENAASQINHLFINMEHSYMGDMYITYICPSGQSLLVHQQGGGGTFLGEPVDDENFPETLGVGYDYFWDPLATNGAWAENAGGTLPSGAYESANDWSALDGCPVNGTWTLEICDFWGADNGAIFDWGIAFADEGGVNPTTVEPCGAYWSGPGIFDQSDDCTFSIIIPDTDSAEYVFSATNTYGCTWDTLVTVEWEPVGCMDPEAFNYDPAAGCPGACQYFEETCEFTGAEDWLELPMSVFPQASNALQGVPWEGAWVMNVPATVSDPLTGTEYAVEHFDWVDIVGMPPGLEATWPSVGIPAESQGCFSAAGIPEQPGVFTFQVIGDVSISIFGQPITLGTLVFEAVIEVEENLGNIPGCTYSTALNFVPYANVDDGSCEFAGCTDAEATNYSPLATVDDGSCDDGSGNATSCASDTNNDGIVSVADLLILLGEFGTTCP